jgi:hypothetical protein
MITDSHDSIVNKQTLETKPDSPNTSTEASPAPNNENPDPLHNFKPEPEPAAAGHGHHIAKPSAYVQQVQQGEEVATEWQSHPKLPPSLQVPKETSAIANELSNNQLDTEQEQFEYAMLAPSLDDPTMFEEARYGPSKDKWIPAIQEEIDRMQRNETWTLVKPPPGVNIIGSKWTYLMKRDAENNPIKVKARLVAQGFSQVPGVNFNETFAPTANLESICLILALAN